MRIIKEFKNEQIRHKELSAVSKFGHFVNDLKAFECIRAAVCIYFNDKMYKTTNEFNT